MNRKFIAIGLPPFNARQIKHESRFADKAASRRLGVQFHVPE
jgi:hypothetical protein